MNDTFRDQTGDDDLRDLLVRAGADAPMPHDWHDVVDRFDRDDRHRDGRRRRSVLAVAAVIALVGFLGVVAALQVRSGDDGDQPIDRPSTTVTGQVTDPLAGLSGGDWAAPGQLPDGYEIIVAMELGTTRPGNGRLLVGGDDVAEVTIITRDDRPADAAPSDTVDAVQVVDVAGIDWELGSLDDVDGNPLEYFIERVVDDRVVTLTTAGDLDALVSIAASLRPVPDAELDVPRMSEDGTYTTVATLDDVEVTAHGVNDVFCVRIVTPDGTRSGTCGIRTEPGTPVIVAVSSRIPAGGFTAGLAEADVARIEFVRSDGDRVVVEPTDVSGSFDQRFWLTDESGVGAAIDHVIVTYDDASTATARLTPAGWTLVAEPPDPVPTTTAP